MGLVLKELSRIKLPDREKHNSRLFIDLCENIHIHYREIRIVFSLDEFFEFVDIVSRSTEDVRSYLAQNPDYKEGLYGTTIMIAGGSKRQGDFLRNSPMPNKSSYFNNHFAIELQDESITDEIHVHWRDYRLVMPIEHFKLIAESFETAKSELENYLQQYTYKRKFHQDRAIEDIGKAIKNRPYETKIMGEDYVDIKDIKTKFKLENKSFNPKGESIEILKKAYTNNERVAPIILSTEKNGTHFVIDGHHRLFAAKKAELKKINCIVTNLTFKESGKLRSAEALLKEFDVETNHMYNTNSFITQYFAQRASRYYYDHFHKLLYPTKQDKINIYKMNLKHNLNPKYILIRILKKFPKTYVKIKKYYNKHLAKI